MWDPDLSVSMCGKHDASLNSCVSQGLVFSSPLRRPCSHFCGEQHSSPAPLLTYSFPVNTWCLEICFASLPVYTHVYSYCVAVWELRKLFARKEKVVKAVVVGLCSQRCQCSGVRWLDPCGRQFAAPATAASPVGPGSATRIWALFDGLVLWTWRHLTGHCDENKHTYRSPVPDFFASSWIR